MKDPVLPSTLRLKNINTVFHEGEEERGDDRVCLPSASLRFSTPFLLCATFSTTRVGGKLTCFFKSKKQREVSHEWDLSLLISFHALVTATV